MGEVASYWVGCVAVKAGPACEYAEACADCAEVLCGCQEAAEGVYGAIACASFIEADADICCIGCRCPWVRVLASVRNLKSFWVKAMGRLRKEWVNGEDGTCW